MRNKLIGLGILLFIIAGSIKASNYPALVLKDGDLAITLLLPNCENGYYRASRFDWGSMIGQIEYKDCTFLQDWRSYSGRPPAGSHDPLFPNTGTGLAEEFSSPQGYEEAGDNGHFLKIGVGILVKEGGVEYSPATAYKIVDYGKRQLKRKSNSITLTHTIDSKFGYGYELQRCYRLEGNKLIVEHRLKNTGVKRIVTETYVHNFLQFNYRKINTDYTLRFLGSRINPSIDSKWVAKNRLYFGYNEVTVASEMNDFNSSFGTLDLLPKCGDFVLFNSATGMSVTLNLSEPVSSFGIWFWQNAFCPEPKTKIDIRSGETFSWSYIYTFYPGR